MDSHSELEGGTALGRWNTVVLHMLVDYVTWILYCTVLASGHGHSFWIKTN